MGRSEINFQCPRADMRPLMPQSAGNCACAARSSADLPCRNEEGVTGRSASRRVSRSLHVSEIANRNSCKLNVTKGIGVWRGFLTAVLRRRAGLSMSWAYPPANNSRRYKQMFILLWADALATNDAWLGMKIDSTSTRRCILSNTYNQSAVYQRSCTTLESCPDRTRLNPPTLARLP